jgi:hypothetical protein
MTNALNDGVDYIGLVNAGSLMSQDDFSAFWSKFLPRTATSFLPQITAFYPKPSIQKSPMNMNLNRLASAIQDEHICCNAIWVHQRAKGSNFTIYNGVTDFESTFGSSVNKYPTNGRHGSELANAIFPRRWNTNGQYLLEYVVRHALYGDPNLGPNKSNSSSQADPSLASWSQATSGPTAIPSPAFKFGTFTTVANAADNQRIPAACTMWASIYDIT